MESLKWPFINFFLLFGFVIYKTKTPFFKYMIERQKEISENLNKSKVQAQEAAGKKAAVEARLASLESEKAKIFAEWKEKEVQQTAALKESSVRIIAQMKAEAEQNKKALEASIQAETALGFRRAVLAQALTKISQSLNPETHKKMNERFVKDVSGAEA
jgi:F0F1-type ATP synthase membrane subunit b/b'